MFDKRAQFNLIDVEALNTPEFMIKAASAVDSFIKDQLIIPNPESLQQVIEKIAASSKESFEEKSGDGEDSPVFDLQAEIDSHPDSLFIKCFAIKADETNDNGDYFSRIELKKATPTFVGVPLFTNHSNADINEARGKVVHSWWDEEQNGIMIVGRVDAEAYPQLARGIREEYVVGTSMGASRGHDLVTMSNNSQKRVDEIKLGDNVITHTGQTEAITAICKTQEHKELYQITWSGNKKGLALSHEHPVLVLKNSDLYIPPNKKGKIYRKNIKEINKNIKPVFIPSSELKAGDYVLELINQTVSYDSTTQEDAFLLGTYAAEGYVTPKRHAVEFCCGIGDPNISKLKSILESRFSIKETIIPERNGHYIKVKDKGFANLCLNLIGTGSKHKKLSNKITKWPHKLQKAFLGAYIDGDGCKIKERIDKNNRSTGKGALNASSASLSLLQGMRLLSLRLGVPARLNSVDRVASKSTVMNRNTKYTEHSLTYGSSISTILNNFSVKAFTQKKTERPKFDSFFYGNKYIAHPIREIRKIPNSELTYYMQVGELGDKNSDHSYILNEIATHNCQVAYSLCSVCHNYAETPDQYCSCIQERKTRMVQAKNQVCKYHERGTEDSCPICGSQKNQTKKYSVNTKVFEYNYGIKFIENSFVVSPACSDCGVTEIIDPHKFRTKVAAIEKLLPRLLKAAGEQPLTCTDQGCIKIGGQQELDSLNQALDMLSSVSQSMLNQKEQIDLEFLSDLVQVLAELQTVTDELTEQGYGRLQSPGQPPSSGENPEQIQQGAPEVTNAAEPLNPTPGGGSKVHSGPAGQVGNVTSPFADTKRLNLEKLAKNIIRRGKSLNIPNIIIAHKRESIPEYSDLSESNKVLKVVFSLS